MCSHSTLDTRFGRAITARNDTMSAAKTREKMVRLVLYVSQGAVTALAGSAARRSASSGIEVTPEVEARALLYAGLGLGADGLTPKEHEAALSPATRAGLDAGLASARSAAPVYLGSFAPPGLTNGHPQGGGGPARPNPDRAYTGLLCVECREPQYETPGGETCVNGHDGAGSMDPPTYDIERRARS